MTWGVLSAVTGLGNHEHMADDDHQAKVDAEFRQLLDDLDKLAAKWSRLSEHVYLKGELTNPLAIPLLPGTAQIYVESVPEGSRSKVSNFVGQDHLGAVAPGEAFSMYLGVDQNVKVSHTLKRKETLSKASSRTTNRPAVLIC